MIKRRGLGPEDIIHKQFANQIAAYGMWKKLNKDMVWNSYSASGEKRNLTTGSLLKAKGLTKGFPDYHFRLKKGDIMHHIYIEFKAGKNKQSFEQKEFEKSCEGVKNERYYVAYSVDERIQILERESIILI